MSRASSRPTGGTTYTTHLGGGATDTAGTPTWPLANPHGDLIGATDANGTFTAQGLADEFGNGHVNTDRNGWLGTHERTVDHTGLGWYRMGVRLYDPTTARFHQVDPIEGGSANDYDYGRGDPSNQQDLDGRWSRNLGNGNRLNCGYLTCTVYFGERSEGFRSKNKFGIGSAYSSLGNVLCGVLGLAFRVLPVVGISLGLRVAGCS